MTDDATLRQALAYARRGWPVFPCLEGQKVPATRHGYKDASTDPEQISGWFTRRPDYNLAIATGAPGPDVLDVDVHGAAGNGYAALGRLHCAGLLEDAFGYVRTPSGGLHIYFTGTDQRNGHLAAHHVDFRSSGGYVLAPPSQVDSHPYLSWGTPGRQGTLSWERVCCALPSQPQRQRPEPRPAPDRDLDTLARWLARQPEGNRNAGLYWAANRALETDSAADLSPLADAARQAGLGDQEINRTLDSARRTGQAHPDEDSARIARALGVREMTIRQIVRGDARTVSIKLRDAITELYDTWWDKRAPARTSFDRGAVTAARKRAIAGNWCAGAALDDDLLDVPGYRPRQGWKPATGTGVAPDVRPRSRRQRRDRR